MKKCWCQQNSRDVSSDLYIFWVFPRYGITAPSFIIVGYMWQILGRGAKKIPPPPIHKQSRRSPSWIELTISRAPIPICQAVFAISAIDNKYAPAVVSPVLFFSNSTFIGKFSCNTKNLHVMNKYVSLVYVSRDTSPIIGQRKWLCRTYLKEICESGWKQ